MRVMSAAAPAGRDWVEMYEARDNARRGGNMRFSRDDPRFLLRMLTEESRLFREKLSRVEQSWASELRDTGNKWGHGEPFNADDTYRALDTMERLLVAVDATAEADACGSCGGTRNRLPSPRRPGERCRPLPVSRGTG